MLRNPAVRTQFVSYLILLLVVCEPSFAHENVRLLQFPTEYSVGTLGLLEKTSGVTAKGKVLPLGEARGLVKVPRDKLVKMFPGVQFYQHPQCLLKLPLDGIDFINLRFTAMSDADESVSDRLIPYIHHLSGLKGIDLDKSETTDAGLAKLGTMPELRALALAETMVTGKCLGQLTGCKKLEALRFGKGTIDNESLRYAKEFPQLVNLELSRTNLSLRGLEHVSKCTKLRSLDINENSAIDDRAVPLLLKLSKLENLHIKRTKISFAGLMQLSKIGLLKISLPMPFSEYSKSEQEQIKKQFPHITTKPPKESVDSYTQTMFGPMSR